MIQQQSTLTVEEFLNLPETKPACELIDGEVIPKMSPKGFHAAVQAALLILIQSAYRDKGRIYPEWEIRLKRHGNDWVPVPDLTYISFDRLPSDWLQDEPCPLAPELTIEIISPGQAFSDLVEKATDYLNAGVSQAWIADTHAQAISVFYDNSPPITFRNNNKIFPSILFELELTPNQIFQLAGLP